MLDGDPVIKKLNREIEVLTDALRRRNERIDRKDTEIASLRTALDHIRVNAQHLPESCLSLKKEIIAWCDENSNEQTAGGK